MPVPSSRTPVRVARGTYANLSTVDALAALNEGEICFATDQQKLYVKQGGGLTPISAASAAAPAPNNVTASPAFAGGTGTEGDPYQITSAGVPISTGTAVSAQTITVTGGAGDFLIVSDESPVASGDRFANQSVGNLDAAGEIDIQFTYKDNPGTVTDNVTYVGEFRLGTTYFVWNVVQSNLTAVSQDTAATITGTVSVGSVLTANPGSITGGTASYSVTGYQWQKSFDGITNFFDIVGSTSSTYTIASSDSYTYLRCIVSHADSTPAPQGGPLTIDLTTGVTAQIAPSAAPVINNVTLTEDDPTGNRFTSQAFSVNVDMLNDGAPVSQKGIKATVTADLQTFADFTSSSTSYTETVPSSTTGNIWVYDTNDAYWGVNSDVSNYRFYPAGIVGFIPPGSSQFRTAFFHNVQDATNTYYWVYMSQADVGTRTSLAESNFTFVDDTNSFSPSTNASYDSYNRNIKMHNAPLAPDGTTPFFIGCGHDSLASSIGYLTTVNNFGNVTYSTDYVTDAIIDKNYRAWGAGSYANRTNSTGTYRADFVVSNVGPWTQEPSFGNPASGTSFGMFVATDADGQYIVLGYISNSTSQIWVADVDVCTTPTAVKDNAQNIKSFSVATPAGSLTSASQYTINALYFKDLEIILVGTHYGVMRIDVTNETATDVTPGTSYSTETNWKSPQGYLEDLRTPQYPNSCSYYAFDPSNTDKPARYVTTDAGNTWTKQYYDNNSDNSDYASTDSSAAYSKRILNMRYNGYYALSVTNTNNLQRTGYSVAQVTTQTVTFAAEANCQFGVPYYPVGGPMNTASVIMMRSSGLQTSAVVNAGYEIQPGTVYESKTSTGTNSVSKFMVISATGVVEDQTSTDPGFVELGPSTGIGITFPASLPSGNSPDVEFPAGASLQVEVEATNSVASDTYTSGSITPA